MWTMLSGLAARNSLHYNEYFYLLCCGVIRRAPVLCTATSAAHLAHCVRTARSTQDRHRSPVEAMLSKVGQSIFNCRTLLGMHCIAYHHRMRAIRPGTKCERIQLNDSYKLGISCSRNHLKIYMLYSILTSRLVRLVIHVRHCGWPMRQ